MTRILTALLFVFVCLGTVMFVAAPVSAHALFVSPMPRDQTDGYKDPPRAPSGIGPPCGIAEAAAQPHTTLTAGASITVTWRETITHPGCFVIDFAPANDANWVKLAGKSHANPPSASTPRNWSTSITVPSTPCEKCTLRLRQIMLNSDVADAQCPPATIAAGATYYSCANIAIGGGGGSTGGGGTTGAGGATGNAGRGGTTGGAGRGGATGSAGNVGSAGVNGTAGTGTAGTTGAAGTGTASGTAGTGTVAGTAGTTGAAGTGTASGTAGTGTTTGAGGSDPTGTAGSNGGGEGGCRVAAGPDGDGAGATTLVALLGVLFVRRQRCRRSRP